MGKIIFVRHGEPDDFDEDGHRLVNSNSRLSERGQNEARRAGDAIKKVYAPKYIVSSSAKRTYQTAELINEQIGKNFEIHEIGIYEEMQPDFLPYPPKILKETYDKAVVPLKQAYAEAKRTIQILKLLNSKENVGDIIHVTFDQRMIMIHWILLNDQEPTKEKYLEFCQTYGSNYESPQFQHSGTRFCKMFAVDLNKEKNRQVEYPYQLSTAIE